MKKVFFFSLLLVLLLAGYGLQAQTDPGGGLPGDWPGDSLGWGNNGGWPGEPSVEDVYNAIAAHSDCLAGIAVSDFATVEELMEYVAENCDMLTGSNGGWPGDILGWGNSGGWPGDSLGWCNNGGWPGEPSVEDVYNAIAAHSDCLAGTAVSDFATVEELMEYVAENCDMLADPSLGWPGDSLGWGNNGGPNGNGPFSGGQTLEELVAHMMDEYPACFEGTPVFASIDELFAYLSNCEDFNEGISWDWEDGPNTGGLGWQGQSIEVFADLSANYGDCLSGMTAADFPTINALLDYVFQNCESDWVAPTVESEWEWISAEFADCLAGYTAADFTDLEALHQFIQENCEQNNWGGGPGQGGWEIPACLEDTNPEDFTTLQAFMIYLAENCADEFEVPACVLDAPEFATNEEFIDWLEANCPDIFTGGMELPGGGVVSGVENVDNIQNIYTNFSLFNPSSTNQVASGINTANVLSIALYPIPALDVINLSVIENVSKTTIYNQTGQSMVTYSGTSSINIAHLPAGIYTLKADLNNGKSATGIFIKN